MYHIFALNEKFNFFINNVISKYITICKVLCHIGIKGNEEAKKTKEVDIPGTVTTRLALYRLSSR